MPNLIRHPALFWIALTVAPYGLKKCTTCPAFAGMTTFEYLSAGAIAKTHYFTGAVLFFRSFLNRFCIWPGIAGVVTVSGSVPPGS